jgi:hypothetical protein
MKAGKITIIFTLFIIVCSSPHPGHSYDISNRLFHSGITARGNSGLLITKGGTSIPQGTYFIGISPDYFDRDIAGGQSESKLTVPLNITYGLPYNLELAGNLSYVSRDNSTSDSDFSDIGFTLKWSFLQEEGMSFPSLAAGISGRLGLGDLQKGTSDIDDHGFTIFISGTALIDLGAAYDYAFGIYGEGGAVFNDLGNDAEDKHGTYSAGVMLPIPPYSDFGFILEFGGTINKGQKSNEDIIRLMPALRINYKRASFTAGINLVSPEPSGEDTYLDYVISAVVSF